MINIALSIIEFVIVIGILAFLHEFGHFIIARFFKIEVEEFGFGLPPRIVRLFRFGDTDVTLNWIPFGAFVRPKGENDPSIAGGLAAARPMERIAVLFGGPLMNLLTGILLFSILFQQMGMPDTHTVVIKNVSQGTPAEQAGLQSGDVVVKINDVAIQSTDELLNTVTANRGKEISLTYQRNSKLVDVRLTPRLNPPAGQGALGIQMGYAVTPINYGQSLYYSFTTVGEITKQIFMLPYHLIAGQVPVEQARIVGPKGMYDMYEKARATDQAATATPAAPAENLPINTIDLVAMISIAMGLTNLFPIPALDGGRILFVLPELIIHRRVPPEYENMVHLIGFAMLLMLMVFITAQDIINPIILP